MIVHTGGGIEVPSERESSLVFENDNLLLIQSSAKETKGIKRSRQPEIRILCYSKL
jgi:hypothetical protein